jgi:hypothetical protein
MLFFSYSTTKAKRIQIEQATIRKILSFFANSVEFGPPGFTEAKRILDDSWVSLSFEMSNILSAMSLEHLKGDGVYKGIQQ